MIPTLTRTSFTVTWFCAVAIAIWIASATGVLLAWVAVALVVLMPALLLTIMAQAPDKTIAEIIYDTEVGRRP